MNFWSIIGMLTTGSALLFVVLAILEVSIFYWYAARMSWTVVRRRGELGKMLRTQKLWFIGIVHHYAWNEVDYVQGPRIGRVYWNDAIRDRYEAEEEEFDRGSSSHWE